jgi:integrase
MKIVKGELRGRPGKHIVDYHDATGARRWKTFDTRREAEAFRDKTGPSTRRTRHPRVPADVILKDYGQHWLGIVGTNVKPRTVASYRETLERYVLPVFGERKLRTLGRGEIASFLADRLNRPRGTAMQPRPPLSRSTVRIILATLRALFGYAVTIDEVLDANPASGLSAVMRLQQRPAERQEKIKAMTPEQLDAFLYAAADRPASARRYFPLFMTLARTGTRLGEALALTWDHVDLTARAITIAQAFSGGRLQTPKNGRGRTVDMSQQLAVVLRKLQVHRATEKLKRGWTEMPPWVFCTTEGTPFDDANVRKAFRRVLKVAKLPGHFTPHCLRHTYASILLARGGVAAVRSAATRARLDHPDRGHLREVAAAGQQGGGGRPGHGAGGRASLALPEPGGRADFRGRRRECTPAGVASGAPV